MYTRNYSKFSSEDFYDDISIQNWNYDLANATDLFNDFFGGLKVVLIDMLQLKNLILKKLNLKLSHG